jgi:hypothetical protein
MDGSGTLREGVDMALKDLERLTRELEQLTQLLRAETRRAARALIFQRVQEIIGKIQEGTKE